MRRLIVRKSFIHSGLGFQAMIGDTGAMMTEQPTQATALPGAAMDRRVGTPPRPLVAATRGVDRGGAGARRARAVARSCRRADRPTSPPPTSRPARSAARRSPITCRSARPSRRASPRWSASCRAGRSRSCWCRTARWSPTGSRSRSLANPSLKLDVLTREAQIASQLGGVAGENLGIERNRLDRAGQIAQANYDLIKARRDLSIRQQLHDRASSRTRGSRAIAEEAEYQEKRLAQLQSGSAAEARITATQGQRLEDTRGRLTRQSGGGARRPRRAGHPRARRRATDQFHRSSPARR